MKHNESTQKYNNLWNKKHKFGTDISFSSLLDLQNQLNHFNSTCTPGDFTKNLFVKTGLWGGLYEFVDVLGADTKGCMDFFERNDVINLITQTFSGCCRDCNLKMTVNKFILPFFKLLIPEQGEMGDARNTGRLKLSGVKLIGKRGRPAVKVRKPGDVPSRKTKVNDEMGMLYNVHHPLRDAPKQLR
jgi:hypothetical protein